ncbi:hypothetical protein PR003_g3495 [Phytophthora rubi]|uniref:Uncharacterized protein n=1 Tax=Phytophthora rubi TaxID=129364 RepID=A0A6A4FPT2_9STRA|nr:hypothetical protein PR001_g3417 [Phytophthora rubi]KAE9354165.1 hypothetical protein PR003_g3495 [Phytophthora rubi]
MSAPLSAGVSTSGQHATPSALEINDSGGHHDGSTSPGADVSSGTQSPTPVDASPRSPRPHGATGDDETSNVGQDSAPRPVSPRSAVSSIGVLNFDEVVRHVRAGVLPSRDRSSPGMQNTPPARFTLPPARNLVGDSFIVGIPAHAMAYRNGAYVREGYVGVEALMLFDGLSEPDVQDLCALVGDPAEVREMVLRPYRDQPSPIFDSLETTLGSLLARREFASLVTHFSPFQLAQRTLYTVSLLHRVLARDRQREHILQGMDENSIARRLLRLQGEHDRLKEDFVFLYGYYQQETQSIRDEASHAQGLLEADFARLARENLEETAALRQRNDDLESQLRYAQSQISTLDQHVRDKRFDADGLLAFLNTGTMRVEAADKSFRMIPPYPGPAPPDSDENDDDAEQEEKSEDNPPSPDPNRDVPRGKEPRKSLSGSKRRASSHCSVDVEVQCRPTVHPESQVGPRPASEALPYPISDACALLPEFIAWEDLYPDVQWAMRTGLGYDEAVDILLADAAQHALFHRDSLCDMLATMMYRHKLDDTLWARYVPTAYYVMAEVVLENWLERGVVPSEWPDLHNLTEDLPEVIESSSSEEVDNSEDPGFDGPSPKDDKVDPPQAEPESAETSPPDSDVLVLRSKRKL